MKSEHGMDVTSEYITKEPSKGAFVMEKGYDPSEHEAEITMAKRMYDQFGGDITLLAETDNIYLGKRADYLWNHKLWELKSTSSAKSIDSVLRKALKQIRDNPGGVVLDLGKSKDSISRIESAVSYRINKSCRFTVDIMIVQHGEVQKIIRYKK